MTVFDVVEERKKWAERITPDWLHHLVFLHESSVNVNMTRRFDGEKAFMTYQGRTTGERFVAYLKDTLLPTLHPGDIVVMDNMRSHHVKAVGELLETKGMIPLYLPPYSPDLNPIEKMWSKPGLAESFM